MTKTSPVSFRRPSRKALMVLGIGLGLLALLYVLAGYGMVHQIAHHRVVKLKHTHESAGLSADSIALTSSDGTPLQAWFVPADSPRGVVVVLHGMDGVDASSLIPQAPILQAAGYSVVLLDMRAHGRSGGDHIGFAFEEPRDVSAALDWIQSEPRLKGQPVALLGYSMGGATAIRTAAQRPEVSAVVSVSAYASIDEMLAQGMRLMEAPEAVITLFLPAVRVGMWLNYGAWPASASPASDIARIAPRPVLLIHGSADQQIPLAQAYRLQAASGGQAQLWVVEGADHMVFRGDGTGAENREYWQGVLAFLAKAMRPAP